MAYVTPKSRVCHHSTKMERIELGYGSFCKMEKTSSCASGRSGRTFDTFMLGVQVRTLAFFDNDGTKLGFVDGN